MKKFILLYPILLFKISNAESVMDNKQVKSAAISTALNTGIALLKGDTVNDSIKTGALATVSQQLQQFIMDYQRSLKNKPNSTSLKELQDTAGLIHAALLALQGQYNIPPATLSALQKIQKGGAIDSEEVLVSLNAFLEEIAQGNITGTLNSNKGKILAIEKENLKIGQVMVDEILKHVDKNNNKKMTQISVFLPAKNLFNELTKFENNIKKLKVFITSQETFIKKTLGEKKPQNDTANKFLNAAIM